MNAITLPSNRHPVDQLGQIRETIKTLQEREKALREEISAAMGGADSLGGDEWIARQSMSERKGAVDVNELLHFLDVDEEKFDATFRKPNTTVFTIRTERRVVEEV